MINKLTYSLILFLFFVFSTSCISNKKHRAEVATLQNTNQSALNELNAQFVAASQRATELEYKLAEEAGANRALAGMQNVYMSQLDSLQNALSNLGSNAQSTRQDLDQRLQVKDAKIEQLQQKITNAKAAIANRGEVTRGVIDELAGVVATFEPNEVLIDQQGSEVRIQLFDDMMFRSTNMRIRTKGIDALTKMAPILSKYPTLMFQVIGHTDNKPIRGYDDNWSFSALRAAEVVRFLTEEADVNRNQIIACGKGEFEPRASNETKSGREANQRVEIVISEDVNTTMRKLNKILE